VTSPYLLLIIGPAASGKTTAGQFLAGRGWIHVEASQVFRRLARTECEDPVAQLDEAGDFFAREGFNAVARAILSDIGQSLQDPVVLTGLRTPEEVVTVLRSSLPIGILALDAKFTIRAKRSPESKRALSRRDEVEFSWGLLPKAKGIADRVIVNELSQRSFRGRVEELAETGMAFVKRRGGDASATGGDQLQKPEALEALVNRSTALDAQITETLGSADLHAALATLDESDRMLLRLRYVEDLTQQAIARRLGLSDGTVKVRLHRLRQKLKQVMNEEPVRHRPGRRPTSRASSG